MTFQHTTNPPPVVVTIAGSDSSGGAGIQADIKTISATGSYACSVITAITSQNTLGVQDIYPIPLAHVSSQIDSVFSDMPVAAVKIGMLADSDIIRLVARKLKEYQPEYIVLDAVMVATSGDILLKDSAIETLTQELLPLVTLMTPNIPEAKTLANQNDIAGVDIPSLITALRHLPANAVLLKGGHQHEETTSSDWLITPNEVDCYEMPRILTRNTHGTGCTLSSAIASYLALGYELSDAVSKAKQYIQMAIAHADELRVGQGHGPVHHFYAQLL